MRLNSLWWTLGLVVVTSALSACQKTEDAAVKAEDKVRAEAQAAAALAKEAEAREVGIDAYVYAYPLVTMRLYWPKEKPPSILDGSWKVPQAREAG